jgi:hypothetical protein
MQLRNGHRWKNKKNCQQTCVTVTGGGMQCLECFGNVSEHDVSGAVCTNSSTAEALRIGTSRRPRGWSWLANAAIIGSTDAAPGQARRGRYFSLGCTMQAKDGLLTTICLTRSLAQATTRVPCAANNRALSSGPKDAFIPYEVTRRASSRGCNTNNTKLDYVFAPGSEYAGCMLGTSKRTAPATGISSRSMQAAYRTRRQ